MRQEIPIKNPFPLKSGESASFTFTTDEEGNILDEEVELVPKGKMSGNPTNIVCWLVGGYFNDTVYSVAYDADNLLRVIQIHHYENPTARKMGVKILGITQAAPQDELVVEDYELMYHQETPPAFAIYALPDSVPYLQFKDLPDEFVQSFKKSKGYDLDEQHLDPTKMSGTPRVVNIEEGK